MDETGFEVQVASEDTEIDNIKRDTLDRLAEVLASFKTIRGTRTPKKNSDAKHVAGVIMVEDTEAKSVTFLCSKNEGLDEVDIRFLIRLVELLCTIKLNGNGFCSLLCTTYRWHLYLTVDEKENCQVWHKQNWSIRYSTQFLIMYEPVWNITLR